MNQKKVITDIEEYGFNGFKGYSNLDVFPESIPDDGTDAQYYYEYKDGIFDPYYQIYLKCIYVTPTYSDEVKRLAQIKEDYQGTTQNYVIIQRILNIRRMFLFMGLMAAMNMRF